MSEQLPNPGLNEKLKVHFSGRIVRKDLTKRLKQGANVPVYMLEYLLDMPSVPAKWMGKFSILFYSSQEEAVFKALEVE